MRDRQLSIFLNLETDPSSHWVGQVIEFDANAADVFSFGRNQECLVGSVDLVYRNSWSEIRTLHFEGRRRWWMPSPPSSARCTRMPRPPR